jgi:hypothetical protein
MYEELFKKLYGNLNERKSGIITMSKFTDGINKKLKFGFDPYGYFHKPNTLLYYWWDMIEINKLIKDFDISKFESELLIYFNKRYNKTAERVGALYVGTTERVSDY